MEQLAEMRDISIVPIFARIRSLVALKLRVVIVDSALICQHVRTVATHRL
jgi:hypothetical protein